MARWACPMPLSLLFPLILFGADASASSSLRRSGIGAKRRIASSWARASKDTSQAASMLNSTEVDVENKSASVVSHFVRVEEWCEVVKKEKQASAEGRAQLAEAIRVKFVEVSAQLGQLQADVKYKSEELSDKQQTQKETQARMKKETEELDALRTKSNNSVIALTELVAVLEEKVSTEEAAAAVSAALLSSSSTTGLAVDPRVRQALLSMTSSSKEKQPSSGMSMVLGVMKGMRDGIEGDLAKAETDAAKKMDQYSSLLDTLQTGIEKLQQTISSLQAQLEEKKTLMSQRDEVKSVVETVSTADRDQLVALGGLCTSAKLQHKSFKQAAEDAEAALARAKQKLEGLPVIHDQTLPNATNGTNGTNDSNVTASFLQLSQAHHVHNHGHRQGVREVALNSAEGLQEALRGHLFSRKRRKPQGRPKQKDAFVNAASRVLKDTAARLNSKALKKIASRAVVSSATVDVKMLVALRSALEQRKGGLQTASVLGKDGESDEEWCTENQNEINALGKDAASQEQALKLRLARLKGRNASVLMMQPLVNGSIHEANGTSNSKSEVLEGLDSSLQDAETSSGDLGASREVARARDSAQAYLDDPHAPPDKVAEAAAALDDAEAAAERLKEVATAARQEIDEKSEEFDAAVNAAARPLNEAQTSLANEQTAMDTEAQQIEADEGGVDAVRAEIEAMNEEMEGDCQVALLQHSRSIKRIRLEQNAVDVALRLLKDDRQSQ